MQRSVKVTSVKLHPQVWPVLLKNLNSRHAVLERDMQVFSSEIIWKYEADNTECEILA